MSVPDIDEGQSAACPRCGHLITSRPAHGLQRALAFSIAAAIFLAIALVFPFLSFSSSGVESVMTLPQASFTIYEERSAALAVIIFVAIIGAPALLLLSVLALTLPIVLDKRVTWLRAIGRVVFTLREWNMVDVFIIGVIVSLVKIAKLATVVLGLSFWPQIRSPSS